MPSAQDFYGKEHSFWFPSIETLSQIRSEKAISSGVSYVKKIFLFNVEGYLTHLKQSPGVTPHCVQKTVGRIWLQALLLRGKGGHQGITVSTDIVMANQYVVFLNFISLIKEPLDESERGE